MLKNIKKLNFFILVIMVAVLVGCSSNQYSIDSNSTDDINISLDEAKEYLLQNWDSVKIDGSTSMIPLHQALNNMFSANKEEIKHGKTVEAFEKFISGENDILLGVTYSDELLNKAKAEGIDFVGKEITKEAFVFLINKENPVKSLTVEQIKGIYSGKITNWSEVGGDDAPIMAYQRNDDSGSQIRMNIFMGDEKLMEKTYFAGGMGELILVIANFDDLYSGESKYAIGYNMYTFTEKQYLNDDVVLLSINGIKPNDDTIFDDTYPIGIYNYMYYDKNNKIASEFAANLYTFLMSGEGQRLISSAGYVNIEEKLIRNLNIDFSSDSEGYISFYNEEKGEFYSVTDEGKLIVYNSYSDFILRDSQYKNNQNANDFLTMLFDSKIITSKIICNGTMDYIGIQAIWFDASFDPEDYFNIKYNGCYYSDLKYYFLEDKYILESIEEEELQYYHDYMVDSGFPVDAISLENIEITKDDLKNIHFRKREWKSITKFSDIEFEKPFHLVSYINTDDINQDILDEKHIELTDEILLLGAETLTEEIIYSVYRGKEDFVYEMLLYALASNDSEGNLYKGYFPFDEKRQSFIFSIDKCKEVLTEVFGEKEYTFEDYMFEYDELTDTYYKCLDFGWNTGYIAENITSNISNDKSEIDTAFELINLWYPVNGDPVPTCIADCRMLFSVIKDENRSYLRFETIEFAWKEDIKND